MAYRKRDGTVWYTNVPTRSGWKYRSTGVADKSTAKAMDRMLTDLGPRGKRAWDLLDALVDGRLTLGHLYDAYRLNSLDQLRERMQDVDLATKVADWQDSLKARVAEDTRRHYLVHVRTLIPEGRAFWRSELSEEKCAKWLNGLHVDRSTKRKYRAAGNSFFDYLHSVRVLATNPLRAIKAPKENR